MRFNEYYFDEKTIEGVASNFAIEKGIVDIVNTGTTRYKRFEPTIQTIVDHFNFKGSAEHTGTQQGKLNDEYIELNSQFNPDGQVNKTCKTDLVIDNKKISMKNNVGWIFAHGIETANVAFTVVLNRQEALQNNVKPAIIKALSDIKDANLIHKEDSSYVLKDKLADIFVEEFHKLEEKIKLDFIQSVLRGDFKFEESDIGTADYLFVVKFKRKKQSTTDAYLNPDNIDLQKSGLYDLSKDVNYLRKLIDICQIDFRILRKKGRQLQISMKKDIAVDKEVEESLMREYADILHEGFWDELGKLLSKGYEYAKDKIAKFIKFITELFNKGAAYVMKFLDIDVNVDMQNDIEFP